MRLRVLEDAGRCAVPFTTGILIGIGETLAERADSIFAIRQVAREYGGIQEVIVQNFRAKPDTAMRGVPDAELDDLAATVAVARLVLGPAVRMQAPPNLVGDQYPLLLRRRDRRLGRRLAAHPRPREPRAALAADRRTGRAHQPTAGFDPARAADHLPRLHPRAVARPAAGRARGTRSPTRHRAGRRAGDAARAAVAGARRRLGRRGRADRPAHRDRHHRPHQRPSRRLRRGVRRLGRGRAPADRPASAPAARLRVGGRGRAARRRARPGRAHRRARRWRCSTPTGPSWTRWPRWPTRCAGTRSATTSPTW